jgi:hypothetical protein
MLETAIRIFPQAAHDNTIDFAGNAGVEFRQRLRFL